MIMFKQEVVSTIDPLISEPRFTWSRMFRMVCETKFTEHLDYPYGKESSSVHIFGLRSSIVKPNTVTLYNC